MPNKRPGEKAGDPQARPDVIGEKELAFTIKTLQTAQRHRKSKGQKDAEHVRLYFAVMNSAAWLALSYPARVAYLEFKRVEWKSQNKNSLELSYSWLRKYQGMCKQMAARVYIELEALGFIDGPKPENRGGLYGRHNIYRLSTRWQALENDKAALAKAKARIAAFDKEHGRKRPPGYFEKLNDGAACERTLNKGLKKAKSQEAGLREW